MVMGVLLFGGAAPSAHAQNLITQPSSLDESGPDCVSGNSIADAWNTTEILCGKPNIPGEQPTSDPGTNTVADEPTDDANGYFWARSKGDKPMFYTIPGLSSGATYRFETYVANVASGSPDAIVITLQWQDGSGANVGAPVTLGESSPATNAWEQVEKTGIVAPSGIEQAELTVTFDDRGGIGYADVFVDEFFFEETAAAPVNSDPVFASGASTSLTVDEDASATSVSTQLEVDDSDSGQTLEWSVVSGPANGTLSGFPTTAASGSGVQPSGVTYEPNANYSGSDSFEIQVSDGNGGTDNITVNVTVDNLAPVFTSASAASVTENTTGTVLNVDAEDGGSSDGGISSYSISGGADAAFFSINTTTGELSLDAALDFERPSDDNSNNEYIVEVTANDGEIKNNVTSQSITITIDDATEAPVATTNAVSGVTSSAATLNGTVGTGGGPDATITFEYYETAAGSGSSTSVNATPNTVTSASGTAVTADLAGLSPNTQYTFEVISTTDEGTTRGGELSFATAGVPEADVFAETSPSRTAIADGGSFDFGSVDLGATATQTFTVENNGSADLTISGISSSGSSDFQVTSSPSTNTVAPNDQVQLEVQFTPSGTGARSFSISVSNNDPDENPYDVTVAGTGQAVPAAATTNAASSVTETSATLNGTVDPEGVSTTVSFDYYATADGASSATTITADQSPLTGTGDQDASASVSGLLPDTEYTFEVIASNDGGTTRGGTQTFTTAAADLAITDGSSAGLDLTADVSSGTNNNVVGIFELSASSAGASFDAVSITNDNPGVPDISAARLFASADQTLEVGSDTELATVSIDNTSAPATIDFSGFSAPVSTNATYVILAIDVETDADASDVRFFLDAPADLTLSGAQVASVNGQSQSTFSGLPLSNASAPLPVEMAGFEATPSSGDVELQWATLTETNNAGFDVQRRLGDSATWTSISRVEGAGTTSERQSYRFTDDTLPYEAKSVAYRLRQVDVDGGESVTEPVSVELAAADKLELLGTYPNPTRSRATVRFAVPADANDAQLVLYDLLGREVRSMAVSGTGRQKTTLDASGLATGMYFLRLTAGGQVRTTKITVVR